LAPQERQFHKTRRSSERGEIDRSCSCVGLPYNPEACGDAASYAVIGEQRGGIPDDASQGGCNIGLFEKSDALRRHARRHEGNQNTGHFKEMTRRDNRKASIGKSADPGAEQKPEHTAEQQARPRFAARNNDTVKETGQLRTLRGAAPGQRRRQAPSRIANRSHVAPNRRISSLIWRPWRAIQILCQASMITARPRTAALKTSWPAPASALDIAPAKNATISRPGAQRKKPPAT